MTDHQGEQPAEPAPKHAAGPGRRELPRLLMMLWLPAAGILLILGGALLLAQGPAAVEVGWFSYAPLPEDGPPVTVTVPDGAVLLSRSMQAGALLVLAGTAVLGVWGGLLLGRRTSSGRTG